MEKKFKIVSILPIVSMLMILIGSIFGSLAAWDLSTSGGDDTAFYVCLTLIIVVAVVLIFSNFVAFLGIRNGRVKTALLGIGRNSLLQFLGPIAALILALIGLSKNNASQGWFVFVIATFAIAFITTSMNLRSLKAFRKDKENYSYASMIAFISAGALLLFLIAAFIGEFQIGSAGEGNHMVGYSITFSTLFVLADVVSYVALGVLSKLATKIAPEKTLADASTSDIKMAFKESLAESNIVNGNNGASSLDKINELREYKKLFDEGIISKEEFDQKKKELLR